MTHDPIVRIDLEQTCSAGRLSSFPDQWAGALLARDQNISSVVGSNTNRRETSNVAFCIARHVDLNDFSFCGGPIAVAFNFVLVAWTHE
jgi:hypothetical protein